MHRVTVIDSLKKLEAFGDIRAVRRRKEDGKNDSNIYIPRIEVRAVDNPHPDLKVINNPVNSPSVA